ncbi:hypothetical protein [Thauera humireducens]|uniref:hypothetical protein n=1 Tax=Thauera humireducens TaxID=1134435 RepID=UPI0012E73B0C|nr:hypothetical protein [Thauera humireducens]
MPVSSGGFLPFSRDEVLYDGVEKSVYALKEQLAHFVDDPDFAIAGYWEEAFRTVEIPKVMM